MPSVISRLNCFSNNDSKKKKGQKKNGKQKSNDQLFLGSGGTDTSSPGKIERTDTSKTSKYSPQSNNNDHDDNSIPTIDPDYKQVRSGEYSVSDAGGTFGTNNQSLTNFSQAASAFGSMAPSAFGAGGSVEKRLYSDYPPSPGAQLGQSPYNEHKTEEMIEIYAPSGKLGLVIDAPTNATTPIVHAIKDTCPIRKEIHVGDKLVAVDDVDVREMGAVEVSKLISRKSGQVERKLTIIRTGVRGR